ncbi:MAG TPA: YciI family protein [Mycobacterium sp.]|nr:YciI family protein [Mycobacterium sp.]
MFHVLKSTYMQSPDVVEQTRPAHLEWLKTEIEAGRLLLAGRQEDGSGGVLITTDMSAEDAQDIVDRDPYTHAGVAQYERSSFNGAFRAPGL